MRSAASPSLLPPVRLRCEYLPDPVGIDIPQPRLSWRIESPVRGERPAAWQVLVASARELLASDIGDFWDSGQVEADGLPTVLYQGEPLQSCSRYHWKVRWWNLEGQASPWSEPGTFTTGFLHEGEWKPKWIGPRRVQEFRSKGNVLLGHPGADETQAHAVYVRREFSLRDKPVLALIFISGLGHYELRLNGSKVGTSVLDPAWTDYHKRALYASYDVTDLVRQKNAVGIILGNGRHIRSYGYDHPRLACRIEVETESGERTVILSDESWRTSAGPLQENGIYYGERYDARVLIDGWDQPGFDDAAWERSTVVPGYPLSAQMMPPARVTQEIAPQTMSRLPSGAVVFDFGQNFSGWVRLKVKGPMGTEVRLRHAELVNADGSLNLGPNENAEATDIYILRGGGPETYEPRFTYHGFRYVEVSGYPGEPGPDAVTGCFVHTDVEPTGSLETSNELINRIHANVLWGQLSNLVGIPTDCPQRDERHGWLGDAHLSAEEAFDNFDMAAFYLKFLEDIRLAQKEDGSLPDVVPPYLSRLYPADPAWSSAYPTLVELVWQRTGDPRVVTRHYQSLKKYIEFLGRSADRHILRTLGKYGDWCPPGSIVPKKAPVELTSTWFYYHDVLLMARLAKVVGRDEDVLEFTRLAEAIREAFNSAFLQERQYAAIRVSPVDNYPDQTVNVLPLALDMVPPDKKDAVLESLLLSVVRQHDNHLDTGILGTRYLLDVLVDNGQAETAWKLVTQTSYPGWGYMIAEGATTLWERWEKLTGPAMNSQNHIMLGSVDDWFYRVLAGLVPASPGGSLVRIRPHVLGDLTFVEGRIETPFGRVSSSWRRTDESLSLDIEVPVGSAAEVGIPLLWPGARVFESGILIWKAGRFNDAVRGLTPAGEEGRRIVVRASSGTYSFMVKRA